MKRTDKGRAVSRYITASSGIPLLSYDRDTSMIVGPPPYGFQVTTDAASWRFFKAIRDSEYPVVRYDGYIDSVEDAYVGMKLSHFTQLLALHYNSLQDRVTTYIEGD